MINRECEVVVLMMWLSFWFSQQTLGLTALSLTWKVIVPPLHIECSSSVHCLGWCLIVPQTNNKNWGNINNNLPIMLILPQFLSQAVTDEENSIWSPPSPKEKKWFFPYKGVMRGGGGRGGTPPQNVKMSLFWCCFWEIEKTWKSTLVLASIYRKMRLAIPAS